MAEEVTIRGKVENGRLVLETDQVDLPDTPVEITVRSRVYGVTLEEAKKFLANPPELTPEQRKRVEELYDQHEKIADNLNLPPDFIDNLDHYLYGLDEFDKDG